MSSDFGWWSQRESLRQHRCGLNWISKESWVERAWMRNQKREYLRVKQESVYDTGTGTIEKDAQLCPRKCEYFDRERDKSNGEQRTQKTPNPWEKKHGYVWENERSVWGWIEKREIWTRPIPRYRNECVRQNVFLRNWGTGGERWGKLVVVVVVEISLK